MLFQLVWIGILKYMNITPLMLKLGDNILSFDELDLTIEEDTTIGKDILFSF